MFTLIFILYFNRMMPMGGMMPPGPGIPPLMPGMPPGRSGVSNPYCGESYLFFLTWGSGAIEMGLSLFHSESQYKFSFVQRSKGEMYFGV